MQFVIKKTLGGVKQLGQRLENAEGIVVLATFANGPGQRLLLGAISAGLASGGHTLWDTDRKRDWT